LSTAAYERSRARRLLTKYGITVAEYDGLLKRQGGKCAVCDRLPKKIRLAVDHDHKGSGRESVRGLVVWHVQPEDCRRNRAFQSDAGKNRGVFAR
jgi:hypothetical protein